MASGSTPRVIPYPYKSKPPAATSFTSEQAVAELKAVLVGTGSTILSRKDQGFEQDSTLFNGAVKTNALVLVKPTSVLDVSKIVKFCRQNKLELSVKAGGTGVHGWSVAGHVIVDLSNLNNTSISLPDEAPSLHESFQSLSISSKRPSLSSSYGSSGTINGKRNASALAEGDSDDEMAESRGKRKMDSIDENGPSRSTSGSESRGEPSSSVSSESLSRNGSESTPESSIPSWKESSRTGSASSASSVSGPSLTYVNPSPTTASMSFPFSSTSFGSSSSTFVPPTLSVNSNPDPPSHVIVTFGAGVNSKQLDAATASSPYGAFHVPTSAFPVGAGQFLLGGFGFIGRKHGLAMDNLVEAEVVLSDGRIVWVGENRKHSGEWKDGEDPEEVWWGLRGAGSTLGVVTRFRAKAYYLPSVYAGNFIYVFDRATTPSLLRHVRDCIKGSPRTLYTNIIMTAGPVGMPAIVVIQLCFSGKRAEGDAYVQAISSWEGGRCLFQDFSERTFERQQVAVEEVLKGGKGRKWYIKSDMLNSLNDEVIEQTCDRFCEVPDGCTWLFEYTGGGAEGDVKDSCFPTSHRQAAFTVAALHQWGHHETPVEDTRCVTTAEDWINEVIHPHSPGGPLPCFLQSSTRSEVAGVYGENYVRLTRLKKLLDPENFFRHAMWPPVSSSYEDGHAFDGKALDDEQEGTAEHAIAMAESPPKAAEINDSVEDPQTIEGKVVKAIMSGGADAIQTDEGM